MDIRDVHTELILEAQFSFAAVTAERPVAERGGALEEVSSHFQGLALCHLLENADVALFRENLVRSGHARRYFLRRSRSEGNDEDRRLALSRTEAFLDAAAAADLPLAREIATLSVSTWNPGWEYEDDFCYYRILQTLVLEPDAAREPSLGALLVRFERALEGAASWRLALCEALVEREGPGFDEALRGFVEAEQEANDARRDALESYEFLFWPRSFVSVEALALLQLAALRGIETAEAYPLCPAIARLAPTEHRYRDLFAEIERLR
ncbi:MAG: Imm49 family immunity protein [Rhodothermales bacterium]